MNGHEITEHTRLLSHRRYVALIERQPDMIAAASRTVANEISRTGGTLGQRLWAEVLQKPWNEIRRRVLDDGPEGRLLRSNSPFSTLIGIHDPAERTRLWRRAKNELSARMISNAPSAA